MPESMTEQFNRLRTEFLTGPEMTAALAAAVTEIEAGGHEPPQTWEAIAEEIVRPAVGIFATEAFKFGFLLGQQEENRSCARCAEVGAAALPPGSSRRVLEALAKLLREPDPELDELRASLLFWKLPEAAP